MKNKIRDNLPVQDLWDVLEEFYKYDQIVTKDMVADEQICTVTRLATIIEQFFRCIMREVFDNGKTTIPDCNQYTDNIIHKKQLELLLPTTTATKNYLASMLYKFQQIKEIEKEMRKLNLKYCDPQDKKQIENLLLLRHNIIHTVVARFPYYEEIKNYYNIVEEMFRTVLNSLDIPKLSFYRIKGFALDSLDDLKRSTECHVLALDHLEKNNTVNAYTERAQVYLDLGDIENAKKLVNIALDIDECDTDANYCKGMVLQIEKDLERADQFFQKTVKSNPYHIDAYIEHVEYLRAVEHGENCKKVLNEAIKQMPSIPDFYFEQGITLRELGKTHDAEEFFVKGDKLVVNFVTLHSNDSLKYDSMIDMLVKYNRTKALRKCGIGI